MTAAPRFTPLVDDVWRLSLLPFDALNVYLIGDVLIDSGMRLTRRRLLQALRRRPPTAHALTHAHPDHQGASRDVCREFAIPLLCGQGDRAAAESGDFRSILADPRSLVGRVGRYVGGPGHPTNELCDGDEIGGFRVLATPGHTPGHLAFWREADRILIVGDVLFHRNPATMRLGLREPFRAATQDPSANRASACRLADLRPATVAFGHGPPLADGGEFTRFVRSLPRHAVDNT